MIFVPLRILRVVVRSALIALCVPAAHFILGNRSDPWWLAQNYAGAVIGLCLYEAVKAIWRTRRSSRGV
jgi:hypothetical protein